MDEGPCLETLLHRLSECPPDFLLEPCMGKTGVINVPAVVCDLLRDLGSSPDEHEVRKSVFDVAESLSPAAYRNRLRMILVASWLFHDDWFCLQGVFADRVRTFIAAGLTDFATVVQAPDTVSEPDRREELVRFSLHGLGLRPAGETDLQSQDRLAALSTSQRIRVIRQSRVAEERARQIREAMVRKAAEEAAAAYGRD
jgi:hypothetical protein